VNWVVVLNTGQDILAPPFRRHRFGATVSALTVSALGHFGTGRFGAGAACGGSGNITGTQRH